MSLKKAQDEYSIPVSIESECLIFRVKELDDMLHIWTLLFIILYIL